MIRRIRIVCRVPDDERPAHTHPKYPAINGPLANIVHTRVFAVRDDGTEEEIAGVMSVSWSVSAPEAATATIQVLNAEIDAEALIDQGD